MTIGVFSRASLLSVRSLRAYHERGILIPASIDPETGYRAYHPGQLSDAVALRRLRELDVPLDVIGRILDARDPDLTGKLLADHAEVMQARLVETERIVAELQGAVAAPDRTDLVHVRTVEHRHALAIRDRMPVEGFAPFFAQAYPRLAGAMASIGVAPAGPPSALFAPELHDSADEPAVAIVPIVEAVAPPPGSGIDLIEVPAVTAAVAVHRGPYDTIGDTYASLGEWVAYHARASDEWVRECYLVSYEQTTDHRQFRTEIHWPILEEEP